MKRELSDSDSDPDLLDEGCGSPMHHSGMDRKKRRGIIEKRRRDRINHSLTELKRLVPAAYEKQGSAKLEKAEILQMTVDHLKVLNTQKGFSYHDPSAIAMDYRSLGFRECLGEVARYLMSVEGLDQQDPLRLRLLSHLQCFSHQRENEMAKTRMVPAGQALGGGGSGGSPTWMAAAATGGAPPGPTAATSVYAAPGHTHSGATTPVGFVADPVSLPPQQQQPAMQQHTPTNQLAPQQQPGANQIGAVQQHQFPHHLQPHAAQLCSQAPSPASNFALHHMAASSASHMHHNNNTTSISSPGAPHQSAFAVSQTPSPNQYQPVGSVLQGMKQPYRPWGTELGAY